MMLQPSKEEVELQKKYDEAEDEREREEIQSQLEELWKKKREELKDCPFVH